MEMNFAKVEKKWQGRWEKAKTFEVSENSKKKKYYVLEMFAYPSGEGLHMGHAFNFVIGDVFARFKIMNGFNVLHPVGYDALGLPAENAAVKVGTHPADYTNNNIPNFMKQQKGLGLSYDWSRMVNTSDASYYKWDQWIFLKMLERRLAYQKTSAVNWCPSCKTVLANEQVSDGKCWIHDDTKVEVRNLKQWFLRTTEYADELYSGLEKLSGWPEKTRAMQRNWIGRSEGTEICFSVETEKHGDTGEARGDSTEGAGDTRIRNSRGDGGSGVANVVIVHGVNEKDREKVKNGELEQNKRNWFSWIKNEIGKNNIKVDVPLMPNNWNPKYSEWKKEIEKLKINKNSVLVGHSGGGGFLVRWLGETKTKVKKLILVAPAIIYENEFSLFKDLLEFKINPEVKNIAGEIIIFVSDDERNSIKKSVEIFSDVLNVKPLVLKNRGHFTEKYMGTKEFPELLQEILKNKNNVWKIFTTRPDTIFGVTFMVVAAQHSRLDELVTDGQREEVDLFLGKLKSVSEKDVGDLEKEGVFSGSYAVNPANGERVPVWIGNFVVADYGAGMVMAVPAHDQRDFEFAKKYGIEIRQVVGVGEKILTADERGRTRTMNEAFIREGVLVNSDEFDGLESEVAKKKIIDWLIKKKIGRRVVNFKLRDWGISRQRYWGTPIPIVHCGECGVVAVAEKDLPVELPKDVKFGKGNPLETNEKWLRVKCPKCGGVGRRESDTMDTFVNSSWYFMRYCDARNDKKIFDGRKVKYWCPVDAYVGGAEHACMHLIYSRFYVKFLRDIGLVDFDEPAIRLFHQGMINDEGGEKMSKSKGNVVEPLEMMGKYGVDATRFFLLSVASPDKGFNWSEKGVAGATRFVRKVVDFYGSVKVGRDSDEVLSKLNLTIKNVGGYIDAFDYRPATIELRELFDLLARQDGVSRKSLESALKLLVPFCPHVAEELWEILRGNRKQVIGNRKNDFVSVASWPSFDSGRIKAGGRREVGEGRDLNGRIVEDVKRILLKIGNSLGGRQQGVGGRKVYIYVIPFEIGKVDVGKIELGIRGEGLGIRKVKVFAVDDAGKYDPEGKAKKARPGKVAVYVE